MLLEETEAWLKNTPTEELKELYYYFQWRLDPPDLDRVSYIKSLLEDRAKLANS